MTGAPLPVLTSRFARSGEVRWIGLRPARRAPMVLRDTAEVTMTGLVGDRRETAGKRAISLIQFEHLPVIAALMGREEVDPALLRRNLVVAGINLLGLRKRRFRIGEVVLSGTGLCAPCSRMEETLGHGGYTAMRGHGGITAEVVTPGDLRLGDPVTVCEEEAGRLA
ncbi:MOSC domain-containing protein [Rhodobacteraceae bacterium NNCM2]|nr:MOSC domain-containing protein [Coraliihabitans acroporae]